jgi:hypothetical protein
MDVERKGSVRDLQRAIQEIRIAQAERDDAIVELREAERTRLALLAEALSGVFDGLAEPRDEFALAVLPGNPPRFWVDATSFVMLARDKRTFRFLKDTRLGRTVLLESADTEAVADAVTRYVAERIVEKERALEAEWLGDRTGFRPEEASRPHPDGNGRSLLWAILGFLLGAVAGAFLLLVYAWIRVG